ncbi:hypothetical protein CEXT_298351 [Caerostris extrusa]|uniref:Uncharacterized protein n=1 Tax=Caerostris extrusa TaxID=172846 RepID=A0AAV4M5T2_CAEEX|nr:hypothetical protein CEXT_298351 [Caerostris extrusa]
MSSLLFMECHPRKKFQQDNTSLLMARKCTNNINVTDTFLGNHREVSTGIYRCYKGDDLPIQTTRFKGLDIGVKKRYLE